MNKEMTVHSSKIAAIPTMYKGVQFRSRLEAKWAYFYDLIGWKWLYEPFDLNGWIPDFLVNNELLIEIKPITKFKKDVDLIQWDYEYPVMLSGIEPFNLGTMVVIGWDKLGNQYLLKEYNDIYGLSVWCDEWYDIFNNLNGKQFCYDYDHIKSLFVKSQNKFQYKKTHRR